LISVTEYKLCVTLRVEMECPSEVPFLVDCCN
ncbi:hypothetical protein LCGC14_2223720, partial [marine sediment metagenome]